MALRNRRFDITKQSSPILARHAKLKFDETRQVWVILVPERVLAPDDIAVEILQLCDGVRDVDQIIDVLASKYAADREMIGADVIAMLSDLAEKGFLADAQDRKS
jgi:pyrroloquinoline quinone biosynthesis protein D